MIKRAIEDYASFTYVCATILAIIIIILSILGYNYESLYINNILFKITANSVIINVVIASQLYVVFNIYKR